MEKLFKKIRRSITPQNAETLGLLTRHAQKTYPTNGGIILFGKNRLSSFPDAIIRCARFLGHDRRSEKLKNGNFRFSGAFDRAARHGQVSRNHGIRRGLLKIAATGLEPVTRGL